MSRDVNIKFKAKEKEAVSGVQKVTGALNKLAKEISRSPVSKLAISVNSLQNSFKACTSAVKKIISGIKGLEESYRAQVSAETALATAAKNNPYLDHSAVRQLEEFASGLQAVSTVGDEQLLPMMAQLAAAGRTQAEIQDIMSAALDLSATGMMGMDQAVKALNATLSGSAGRLGQQIDAIKGLTREELENGKAIEIIRKQYSGIAQEVATATGSSQQLKNAIGDVKEELGAVFETSATPMRRFFTEAFGNVASLLSRLRRTREDAEEGQKALGRIQSGTASKADLELVDEKSVSMMGEYADEVDRLNARLKELQAETPRGFFRSKKSIEKDIADVQAQLDALYEKEKAQVAAHGELTRQIEQKNAEELDALVTAAQQAESAAAAQAVRAQAAAYSTILKDKGKYATAMARIDTAIAQKERQEQDEAVRNAISAYDQKIAACKEEISQREQLGEQLGEEAKLVEEIAVRQRGLLELARSHGIAWDSDSLKKYKDELGELYEQYAVLKAANKSGKGTETPAGKSPMEELADLRAEAESFLGQTGSTLASEMDEAIRAAEEYVGTLSEGSPEIEQYNREIAEMKKLLSEVSFQQAIDEVAEYTSQIQSITDKTAEIITGITSLVRQQNEQETEAALGELSKQYTDGEISYEEYCERKKEIEKEAAQEEYKLKMWEWRASFLQATASIAQGVAASLAEGGYVGPVLAALTAASGAIQIATIMASKPKAPSFASGGIVPGNSYSGDRVRANVNSGEMILNAAQQRSLWEAANGGGAGGTVVNMPVSIENRNGSAVSTQLNEKGLKVIIDDIVNASMASGEYTSSMGIADANSSGRKIL